MDVEVLGKLKVEKFGKKGIKIIRKIITSG